MYKVVYVFPLGTSGSRIFVWGHDEGASMEAGAGTEGSGLGSKISWIFFASEWRILRAFLHMIRQLTTPVLG